MEKRFVDMEVLDIVGELVEALEVGLDTELGILDGGAGLHDKGPVAGLSEEEFASGLIEGAIDEGVWVEGEARDDIAESQLGVVQEGVYPDVSGIDPELEGTSFAPSGGSRIGLLVNLITGEVFDGSLDADGVVLCGLAEDAFEEVRTFEPPVTEELGIIGASKLKRIEVRGSVDGVSDGDAFIDEIASMPMRGTNGEIGVVELFRTEFYVSAGDAMIFDTGINASAIRVNPVLNEVEREVVTDIAIELAVAEVTGITFFSAPNLGTGERIATEESDAFIGDKGGEGPGDGFGFSV